MEAAEALEPRGAAWVLEGAEDMRSRGGALAITLFRRIIRERADLTFAGRDLALGLGAPPVVVPRDLMEADTAPDGAMFLLRFWDTSLELRFPPPARSFTLHAVRVVRVGRLPADEPRAAAPRGPKRGKPQNGGKAVHPAVTAAIRSLGAKLFGEGLPAPRRGQQASLERWFLQEVERHGGTLSESRVRKHVARALAEHRAAQR